MKTIFTIVMFSLLFFFSGLVTAQEPIISYDVHVLKNSQPSQCPPTIDSRGSPDIITTFSGEGMSNFTESASIRSCTGCAIDAQSKDCVCKQCYDYYN